MNVSDDLKIYEQFRIKQKERGKPGFVHDQLFGDDETKSTGKFNKKVRIIDRKNDRYFECVKNAETGDIMHVRDEKLSEHVGRGSAKFQEHGIPEEQIAVAAYYIWENDGKPSGKDKEHWDQAIEDLKRVAAGVRPLYS